MFNFQDLTQNDKSRLRVTLKKYEIEYIKLSCPSQRKKGNTIDSTHLHLLLEKIEPIQHFGTKATVRWVKNLLKGIY